jgi:hypothetical protein
MYESVKTCKNMRNTNVSSYVVGLSYNEFETRRCMWNESTRPYNKCASETCKNIIRSDPIYVYVATSLL